jgi:superfamily II DNA or RNA helicase
MIAIRLKNVSLLIQGDLPKEVHDEIRHTLSYYVPGYKFMPLYKQQQEMARLGLLKNKKPWDGTKTLATWTENGLKTPTGLFSYVCEVLDGKNIPYEIADERMPTVKTSGWTTNGLLLRDYQKEIYDLSLRRQRGVLKIGTGGGKTEILVKIIVDAGCFPAIFYVTSCDLLEQAYERFCRYVRKDGIPVKIGRIGAGHCDLQPITIATVQSCEMALAGKFTKFDEDSPEDNKTELDDSQKHMVAEFVREAQFVYCDECQHCSAETIQTIMNNSYKARFRLGGSASPWRDDGLDILIESCFGRRICDVPSSFLIKNNYLVRPFITFNHFSQMLGPAKTFSAHYKKYIVENEARNKFIAQRALFHMEQGRPTIILVKWVPHAEALKKLITGSEIVTASGGSKKTPKQRNEIFDRMRRRELQCLIGTSLLDEGVDIPSATTGIFAGGGKSSTRALQRVGRLIRKDPNCSSKDTAFIEEFNDNTRWLMLHSKQRRKILLTEPEFVISDNRETLGL